MSITNDHWQVDFVGIAAPRCGTTWLAACLSEHPEVSFSEPKETFFFSKPELYGQGEQHYETYFAEPEKVCGEFSPFYFAEPEVATRVHAHNPKAKLIALVRDPVDRMRSAYDYRKQKGREIGRSMREAIKREPAYITFGEYYDRLEPFIERFGTENVLVLILEECQRQPEQAIRDLYTFVGVNADFVPTALTEKINSTKASHTYVPLLYKLTDLRKALKKTSVGRQCIVLAKRLGLGTVVAKLMTANQRSNNTYEPRMDPVLEQEMREHFRASNDKLSSYLNRPLSDWT